MYQTSFPGVSHKWVRSPSPPTLNSPFLSVSPSSFPLLAFFRCHLYFFFPAEKWLTSRMLQAPRSIKYAVRAIMTFVYWENHKQSWWMDVKLWTGSFIYLFIWHISARTTWKHEDWYSWVVNSDMHRHACTGFLHRLTHKSQHCKKAKYRAVFGGSDMHCSALSWLILHPLCLLKMTLTWQFHWGRSEIPILWMSHYSPPQSAAFLVCLAMHG